MVTKPKLKLYRVEKHYRKDAISVEFYLAYNERNLYHLARWTKKDKPPLKIKEIPLRQRCFFSNILDLFRRELPTKGDPIV